MPVIGVTAGMPPGGGHYLHDPIAACLLPNSYLRAIEGVGARAVILPPPQWGREPEAGWVFNFVDGLILSGGGDIDPHWFGEEPRPGQGRVDPERDAWEIALARWVLTGKVPVLGICRGMQVMAVAAGGSLYQEMNGEVPGLLKHMQEAPRWYASHGVRVVPGTRLEAILRDVGGDGASCRVNSFHHQAVKDVGKGFVVSAMAPDGVIEAIEDPRHPFAVGVQWHPEAMVNVDRVARAIFRAFSDSAAERAAARGVG